VIPQLRELVLRRLARLLVRSGTFRTCLGTLDPNYQPRFLRAAGLLRGAAPGAGEFVRDLVNSDGERDIVLWVLHETSHKTGGFFVEFGAADGIGGSNTLLLEQEYGWRGILAEPNPDWCAALTRNRAAIVDRRCVFTTSGARIRFAATKHPALATIADYAGSDSHARSRADHRVVEVETVSLNDLLVTHNAPRDIDFMSVDTEGSEYDILEAFDFERWNVLLFSVEHNQTHRREKIDRLMRRNGYEPRYPGYSPIDGWYRRR
jgi:FkbM family methyltransferase